jgi:hypothetical protein
VSGAEGIFKNWRWRWVVLHDSYIAYHKSHETTVIQGVIHIDQGFSVSRTGRYIKIRTFTRSFDLYAPTPRIAEEWYTDIMEFYNLSSRVVKHRHMSSYALRSNSSVEAFLCTRDYFCSVAVALIGAQYDIFISSWKLIPTVLLTRPPLPPIRLDQILKFKANQGVKVYVLLNKEVCDFMVVSKYDSHINCVLVSVFEMSRWSMGPHLKNILSRRKTTYCHLVRIFPVFVTLISILEKVTRCGNITKILL